LQHNRSEADIGRRTATPNSAVNDSQLTSAPYSEINFDGGWVLRHGIRGASSPRFGYRSRQTPSFSGFLRIGAEPQTFACVGLSGRSAQIKTGPVNLLRSTRQLWLIGLARRLHRRFRNCLHIRLRAIFARFLFLSDIDFRSGAVAAGGVVTLNPVRRAPGGYEKPLAPNSQKLGLLCCCRQDLAAESESATKACANLWTARRESTGTKCIGFQRRISTPPIQMPVTQASWARSQGRKN
jgi:hypothetical protein